MAGNDFEPSVVLQLVIPAAALYEKIIPSTHEALAVCFETQEIMEGVIKRRNTGGYIVQVAGHQAFLPGSHSDINLAAVPEADDVLIGASVSVVILEIKANPWQLVVSRRKARKLATAQRQEAEEVQARERAAAHARRVEEFAQLTLGTIVEAVVDYHTPGFSSLRAGALVMRVSRDEWSWGASTPPQPGEKVQVVVTELDTEKLQVRASRRLLLPDPWNTVEQRYGLETAVLGQVTTVTKFGAFVELEPGISALMHRSQMGVGLSPDQGVAAYFQSGDYIPVVIESLNLAERKIGVALSVSLEQWMQLRGLQEHAREERLQIAHLQADQADLSTQLAAANALAADYQTKLDALQTQTEEQAASYAHLRNQGQQLYKERDNAVAAEVSIQRTLTQQQQLVEEVKRQLLVEQIKATRSTTSHAAEVAEFERRIKQLTTAYQQSQQKNQEWEQASARDKVTSVKSADDGAFSHHYQLARKASFHQCGTNGDNPYYCLLPYLPKNAPVIATSEQEQHRRLLYQFKDGGDPSGAIANRLALALLRCFSPADLQELTLAVIPASTRDKNQVRFRAFCQVLCALTGLQNGFAAITPAWDRASMKGVAGGNKTENLTYERTLIKGRRLLLFDDVMTSGGSFAQNAAQLREHGAQAVVGLFLMRTVDRREYI